MLYSKPYPGQGRSQDFSKGWRRHTVSNIIIMAFSPRNIVGCLLKKGLQREGHGYPRTPLATPLILLRFILSKWSLTGVLKGRYKLFEWFFEKTVHFRS